jgi:Ca2+-binding EF-hand superfamily protein
MTNEELIEELYHKAHMKGFFNELHEKVDELNKKFQFKCRHEMVRVAYDELKKIKLAQPIPHP